MLGGTSFLVLLFISSVSQRDFPLNPDPNLTPGSVCNSPDSHRYPERIKYCERDVSSGRKRGIYQKYDQLGYRTASKRGNFKIDHYIPLCAGGSNDESNLWPQHRTVFIITDKLEELVCIKMAEGRLKQQNAISLIKEAKGNLEKAPEIEAYVRGL